MTRRSGIGHLLAWLAVASFLLAPLRHSAMAMVADHSISAGTATAMVGADMTEISEEMPCCPPKASIPDCGSDCPYMALCSAAPLSVPLTGLIVPVAKASILLPRDQTDLVATALSPPRKPPKI